MKRTLLSTIAIGLLSTFQVLAQAPPAAVPAAAAPAPIVAMPKVITEADIKTIDAPKPELRAQ